MIMDLGDDLCNITESDVKNLLELFANQDYNPKAQDSRSEEVLERCIELWKLDYEIEIIPNEKGEFCDSYPARIAIPFAEKSLDSSCVDHKNLSYDIEAQSLAAAERVPKYSTPNKRKPKEDRKNIDSKLWKHNISRSNVARCWNRFPVPVLFINGKYISRSATISATIDVGLKSFVGKFTRKSQPNFDDETMDENSGSSSESRAVHHVARLDDVKLLKMCEVSSIIDFMVEKKKQKYCLNVSSSEKVDVENRYKDFSLYSLPYPGCEFFKKFSERNLNSEDLHHSWNENALESNEAKINLPEDISKKWSGDWHNYKSWDVRTLTDNYIRVILDLLMNKKEKGLLLHCISGWDRTPLFISLIRLLLWGEGSVHCNLSSIQMLYFTLGYDWYLFKHKLNTRINNGEHILYFCFEILSILSSDKIMIPRSRSVSIGSQESAFEFLNHSNLAESNSNDENSNSKAMDEDAKTKMNSDVWPFGNSNSLQYLDGKFDIMKLIEDGQKNRSDFLTREKSINTSNSDYDDDSEISIVETSLSPIVKRSFCNSCPRSPFSGRQSANRSLDFNDPLTGRLNVIKSPHHTEFQVEREENVPMTNISSPLPVPGTERDNSTDSFNISNSSWNYVTKDASIPGSWEGVTQKKDGGIYEKSIGSSLGSASSFLAFDKPKRLKKVRLLFYKLFGEVGVLTKTT